MPEQLTLLLEAVPASRSASLETAKGWPENPASCSSIYEQYVSSVRVGLSGRTSRERCRAKAGRLSDSCSQKWMNSGMAWHGAYWTRNSSEWPSAAAVCSLSEVLETCVPQRYFLSAKACAGIIRRAEKRGKALPPTLKAALETAIRCSPDADAQGGGKGALIQKNVSATLSTSNMQTLFQCLNPWDVQSKRVYAHDSISPTLPSGTSEGMNIQPIVCIPFDTTQITSKVNGNNPQWGDPCHCLTSAGHEPTVCIASTNANAEIDEGLCGTITRRSHKDAPVVSEDYAVRRLTPTECERLQGFPDGWTDIEFKGKPASDTARYKALGNSMAVSVMEWIGKRIEKTNQ